jgi:WD40 repeat protein/tRNA A-37 threonylcarbamoyl transferase component Bud32
MSDSLPVALQLRIEEVCSRFEAAWQAADSAATAPRVEEHLSAADGPERAALLRELLRLDVHYRRRHGESPGADDYTARCPSDAPAVRALFAELFAAAPSKYPALPNYEILGELGRGGMGVVYKARHTALKRQAALKMILAGAHADQADLDRFKTEAEAIARLQHPNIVQVFEVGEHDGLPFFALELCPGGSLEKKLAGTPLPPAEAAALVETLARAVQVAHEGGIIHRDLKPANVLLTEDGTPKITDFGLAKKLDAPGATSSGVIMGSPSYMAPEQAAGRSKAVGPPADIYALGAILYELLTGHPPFKAATPMDTLVQVVTDEPVPVRRVQPKVPRDLETICLKALAKVPGDRYPTAQALADDLRRFQDGEPILARPAGTVERLLKWSRRHPAWAVAYVLVVLVLGLGGVGGTLARLWQLAEDARQEAQNQREEAEKQRDEADEQRQEAERRKAEADRVGQELKKTNEEVEKKNEEVGKKNEEVEKKNEEVRKKNEEVEKKNGEIEEQKELVRRALYGAQMKFADLAWHENRLADLRRLLERYKPGPGDDPNKSLRRFEWDSLWRLSEGDLPTLKVAKNSGQRVFISPDGASLVVRGPDGMRPEFLPVTVTPDGNRMSVRVSSVGNSTVESVCFSPDGARVASASPDGKVRVWDARTGQEALALKGHEKSATGVCFSPDGTLLASSSFADVKVWDARTGREVSTLGAADWFTSVCFSPDGKRLAAATGQQLKAGEVKVWDVRTGREELSLKGNKGPVKCVCWSPDGTRLASASEADVLFGEVKVWDARTGRVELSLKEERPGQVFSVCFSPDGSLLASGHNQTVAVWNARTGEQVGMLKGHTTFVKSVCFSPDGTRLASAADTQSGAGEQPGEVKLWDLRSGRESRSLKGHTCVCFSPDGTRLASAAGDDGSVRLWDACIGEDALDLDAHTGWVRGVCFSPDGTRLASAGDDQTVKLWNPRTGEEVRILEGHTCKVYSVSFSPDGNRLVSAGGDHKRKVGEVKVWGAGNGWEELSLKGLKGAVRSVCWSPDGTRLACAGDDGTVTLWDARTGREESSLKGLKGPVEHVCFSPDGTRLASAGGIEVRVWDARSGKEQLSLEGQGGFVNCVCWSPDGQRLASAGALGTVQVWDAVTGQKSLTLEGHTGQVYRVCWSPDGARVASAGGMMQTVTFTLDRKTGKPHDDMQPGEGSHGEVKLWDATTGQELRSLNAPAGAVAASVCFAPDGNRLASGHSDGTVSIWEGKRDPKDIEPRWRVWQRQRARTCVEDGEWFAAAFHLRQVLKEAPDDATMKARLANALGNLHAEREQWAEAVVEFEKARQRRPHHLSVDGSLVLALLGRANASARAADAASRTLGALSAPFNYSPLSAAAPPSRQGDLSDYRRVCAELLHDYGQTEDAETAQGVAFLCVLGPQAVKDPALVVQLARKAVKSDPDNASYRFTLGAALYRAGDFDGAARELNLVEKGRGGGSIEAKLLLALAHHRLAHSKAAKDWYARALEQFRQLRQDSQPVPWRERLYLQLLGEEAKALLQPVPQP